nr:hypothetical protein [uncultured Cohaesibacter sp.]
MPKESNHFTTKACSNHCRGKFEQNVANPQEDATGQGGANAASKSIEPWYSVALCVLKWAVKP